MFKMTVTLDCPADKLIAALEAGKDITGWNSCLKKSEVLKDLGKAKISYQITKEQGPGGIFAARDFTFIYKAEKRGDEWLQAGCSVDYPGPEIPKKTVRAWNNPGGYYIKSAGDKVIA